MNGGGLAKAMELGVLPTRVALHLINDWTHMSYINQIPQFLG
jgi:hypothetical protein